MSGMMRYLEENSSLLWLLFVVIILAVVFWNLYRRERRRAVKATEQTAGERRFFGAFAEETKSCFFYIQKEDRKVIYESPNFEAMTGIPPRALEADITVMRQIMEQTDTRKVRKFLDKWDQESRLAMEIDYHHMTKPEETCRGRFEMERAGDGWIVMLENITEEYETRRRIEAQLQEAKQESQAKTDFLSSMSHEIRTPMNGIYGLLQLAEAHAEEPELLRGYLGRTEELSEFLLNLINDILDMSRIESGRMELEQKAFDLFGMSEKIDVMFRKNAEAKGIIWTVETQDFQVHWVNGDEMRLSQVIINFISNAMKFTSSGGSVTVLFRQMEIIDGAFHLMIKVSDTGTGIKKEFLSRIFRPFEQQDASIAGNYGGSGLGMAIADEIVRLMKGQIFVESEVGKGTEFTVHVSLPVAEQGEAKAVSEAETEASREAQAAFSMAGLRILLAEDNDINAEIATEILGMEDVSITRAADGAEAVQIFGDSASGSFDVILMDIQMPNMNGWEATRAIRAMDRSDADILIFAMSANAFVEDQRYSVEVGMDGHISKPVDYDALKKLIGKFSDRIRRNR